MNIEDLVQKCVEQQKVQGTDHALVTLKITRKNSGERVRLWPGGPLGHVVASTGVEVCVEHNVVAMFYADEILKALPKDLPGREATS